MTHTAYIAFGSNLSKPLEQIEAAFESVAKLGQIKASPLYTSKAVGPGKQPDYINGALKLETDLEPYSLLTALQNIEHEQGRERSVKNAARTLDLDILLFDQLTQDDPTLIIPHPRMHERNFVIYPLYDLSPELELPKLGPISELFAKLSSKGLKKLDITL